MCECMWDNEEEEVVTLPIVMWNAVAAMMHWSSHSQMETRV